MAWRIDLSPQAIKNLDRLDRKVAQRILRFLYDGISTIDNPHTVGEALRGPKLGEFWKYRVGDYRIIAHIVDSKIRILVVRIGNRCDVYR
ncbi:MAG: type II toxin-antitoxin system RelE/ParE family toxin [Rudaea sp.]